MDAQEYYHQPPMNRNASLYVGDLAQSVTEARLYDLFSKYGPISSIRICCDRQTERSLGYGYVNYHSTEDASKALNNANFKRIDNREIRVMLAQHDSSLRKSGVGNIFIKNLDVSIDNKTLYDTFSMFGDILSSKVAYDCGGNSKGYGFVHFKNASSAHDAIERVDGMEIAGKVVVVCAFKPTSERGRTPSYTNVYVKEFPEGLFPDEESFKNFFAAFGEVTSVFFPQKEGVGPRGFGFVNFADSAVARQVVEQLHKKVPHFLYCAQSLNKALRRNRLEQQYQSWRERIDAETAGRNVFVKNLAPSVTEQALREKFAAYGEVESAKLRVDEKGATKGFGFVLFRSQQAAEEAIKSLHGVMFAEKVLYVALFQRRHIRQRQIEQQALQSRKMMQQGQFAAMASFPGQMMYQMNPQLMYQMNPQMMQQMAQTQRWGMQRGMMQQGAPQGPPQNMPMRPAMAPQTYREAPAAPRPAQYQAQPAPEPQGDANEKELLGERIYEMVSRINQARAGKVTGMFMEMSTKNLQTLLSRPELFEKNVHNAISLLENEEQGSQ